MLNLFRLFDGRARLNKSTKCVAVAEFDRASAGQQALGLAEFRLVQQAALGSNPRFSFFFQPSEVGLCSRKAMQPASIGVSNRLNKPIVRKLVPALAPAQLGSYQ